ncbi:MAG: hypothetical protein NTW33_10990, partial [Methanoregula sp.]|nr:hypothetical protein [Methanoregula sp.]
MIDEVVSTEPAKMEPVEPTIYCIDEVNATSIAEAFSLLVKVGGAKNDAVINRSDLPKLILACCLGDDNAPR